jgi:hypothetical protein
MWKFLYDSLLQFFSLKWSVFISQSTDPDIAQTLRNRYRNDIYTSAGLTLVMVTLVTCIFYYYFLTKRPGYYFKLKYWFSCLLTAAILVGIITFTIAHSESKMFVMLRPFKFNITLALLNTFYSAFLFWVFSILMKWGSPAKTTPRFYPY